MQTFTVKLFCDHSPLENIRYAEFGSRKSAENWIRKHVKPGQSAFLMDKNYTILKTV